MDLSYYNPFNRFKLISSCWEMASKVKEKLEKENPKSSPAKSFIFFDYLLGWIKHGFSIVQYEDYEFYRYKDTVRKHIVTNRRALHLEKCLNKVSFRKYLENKKLFNEKFKKFVNRKWAHSSTPNISALFNAEDYVIIKPVDGEKGQGIKKLFVKDLDSTEIKDLFNNNEYLIEEIIDQNADITFERSSVNTIRIYTLLDHNNEPHILKSVLRVGAPGNDVDNYHCGGSIWPLHKEEGFVEYAGKTLNNPNPIFYLPPQNFFMLGYRIPNYDKAIFAVKEAAKEIPEVRYIGWDVAITKDGAEIIEGNPSPDNDFHCLGYERNYYHKMLELAQI